MYKKQDTNNFIAFQCLFNQELLQSVNKENVNQIETILKTTYEIETSNNYYVSVPINILEIKEQYNNLVEEIEDNPSLIYKL